MKSVEVKDLDASKAKYRICNQCGALNDVANEKCVICGATELRMDPEETRVTIELLREEYGNHGSILIAE